MDYELIAIVTSAVVGAVGGLLARRYRVSGKLALVAGAIPAAGIGACYAFC